MIHTKIRKNILSICLLFFTQYTLQAQDANAGKEIFSTNCTSCHAIGKQVVGPDLKDVDKIRSTDWIIKFVHSSQGMIKSGDTAAVKLFNEFNKTIMPDHPQLKDGDIKNIIAYIQDESKNTTTSLSSSSNVPGDPMPYPNNRGLLHRIIFLDYIGDFSPLSPNSYLFWIALGGTIIVGIAALFLFVRVNDLKNK